MVAIALAKISRKDAKTQRKRSENTRGIPVGSSRDDASAAMPLRLGVFARDWVLCWAEDMRQASSAEIAEKLKDRAAITKAIQRGIREAVLAHARAGHPVAGWRDGKVVWVSPEEILRTLADLK